MAFVALLRNYNWNRIAVIQSPEDCWLIGPTVTQAVDNTNDLQIVAIVEAHVGNQTEIIDALAFVRTQARSILD